MVDHETEVAFEHIQLDMMVSRGLVTVSCLIETQQQMCVPFGIIHLDIYGKSRSYYRVMSNRSDAGR